MKFKNVELLYAIQNGVHIHFKVQLCNIYKYCAFLRTLRGSLQKEGQGHWQIEAIRCKAQGPSEHQATAQVQGPCSMLQYVVYAVSWVNPDKYVVYVVSCMKPVPICSVACHVMHETSCNM